MILRRTLGSLKCRQLQMGIVRWKHSQLQEVEYSKEKFTPVYKFPHIQKVSLINRLKFYQTFVTLTGIPLCTIFESAGMFDPEVPFVFACIGITGSIGLHALGFLGNKLIGYIYLNKDDSLVKVAYLDYWGRRVDKVFECTDVIPRTDMTLSLTDGMYLKFKRYSNKEILKIPLRHGEILDMERFKKVY